MQSAHHSRIPASTFVFIDARVEDYRSLCQGLRPGAEVVVLQPDDNGIEQITQVLAHHDSVESIHIIAHGAPATLFLGNTELSLGTLDRDSWNLQSWFSNSSSKSPVLALYSCNVACGDAGIEFLEQLHLLTGATVYAAATLVGSAEKGGQWDLDIHTGRSALLPSIFQPQVLQTYSGVFATGTGTDGNYRWFDSKESGTVSAPVFSDISGTGTEIPRPSGDEWAAPLTLPFQFNFYGLNSSQISVANNGAILFGQSLSSFADTNANLPSTSTRHRYGIFPYWDDLGVGQIYTATLGGGTSRRFVVQWNSMPHADLADTNSNGITFQVILHEGSNNIDFLYFDTSFADGAYDNGREATIGLNGTTSAVKYSVDTANLSGVSWIRFFTEPKLEQSTITISEGQTITLSSTNFSATDVDNNDPNRIRFDVSSVQNGQFLIAGSEVFNFTQAQINSGAVQFKHNGGDLAPSFQVTVTDGYNTTASKAGTIQFTGINDIPVLGGFSSPTFSENALNTAAAIIDSSITLTDTDSSNFEGGQLVVNYSSGGSAQDQLSLQSGGLVTLSGRDIRYNGVLVGSIDAFNDGSNGKSLIITFTSPSATLETVKAVAESLTYRNISDTPAASRTLSITVNDGDGGTSIAVPVTITVNADNDTPVNTVPAAQTTQEDTPLMFTGATKISIADPDAGTNWVELTLNASNGTLSLNSTVNYGTLGLSFTTGDGVDDRSIIVTGRVDALNTVLDGMVFKPDVNYNGSASVQVITNDRGMSGNGVPLQDSDTIAITVAAVNDDPINTILAAQSVNEDTNLVLSTANNNALRVSDVDVEEGTKELQVTLAVTQGRLTLARTTGLTFFEGNGTSNAIMTFKGSAIDINSALDGLIYRGNANFNGTDNLTMTTVDLGNTGIGGAKSDTDVMAITVNAVNDAPVNTVPGTQQFNEDANLVFSAANGNLISISDIDVQEGTGNAQVTLSVNNGVLTLAQTTGLTFSAGTGTGNGLMTFTGKVADINAALHGLVYRGNLNFNGSDTLTIQTNDQHNTGIGGLQSDSDTISLVLNAVNDAPVITDLASVVTFGENALNLAPALIDTVVTVVDVDSFNFDGGNLTLAYVLGGGVEDQLSIQHQGVGVKQIGFDGTTITYEGAPIGTIDATSKGQNGSSLIVHLNAQATPNGVTALIQNLTYQNTSQTPVPSRTLSITLNDGDQGTSIPAVTEIKVTAANDAPVLGNNSLTVAEGQTIVLDGSNFSAIDVDTDPATLVYTIGDLQNGEFRINNAPVTSFTQAQLTGGQVRFVHNGGEAAPSYKVSVGDGTSSTTAANAAIAFTNTNDAPVLAGLISVASFNGMDINTTPALIDNNITLTDVDSGDFAGGKLTITYTSGGSSEDQLGIFNQGTAVGQIGRAGGSITFGGEEIGTVDATYDGRNGTSLIIHFNDKANATKVRDLIQNLTYQNTSNVPIENRTIAITIDDGDNGVSTPVGTTITVAAENDAPEITLPVAQSINEDEPLTFTDSNLILINDSDAGIQPLQVTLNATQGTLTLGSTTGLSFSTGDGTDDSKIVFTGSLEGINRAIKGMLFTPTANYSGTGSIQIAVDDQGNSGYGGAKQAVQVLEVGISAVNDAPIVRLPGTQSLQEDQSYTFTGNNRISITDVDANTQPMRVSLSVKNGTLSLGNKSFLTFIDGDGVNDQTLTFTGTLADINTALGTLSYQGNANFHGLDNLKISTSDQNATISGGVGTDNKTLGLVVGSVNDAPVNTVPTAQRADEDIDLVFNTTNGNAIRISDLDLNEGTGLAKVTLFVSQGVLTLAQTTGLTFTAGDGAVDSTMTFTGTAASINAALEGLTYRGNSNFNGTDTLIVTTSDEGNSGIGGSQTDTDAISIRVQPTNDAPVIAGTPATNVDEKTLYRFVPTVNDVDGDALTFSIQNKPAWATFDPLTGQLSGIPGDTDVGTTTDIVINVFDGTATTALPSFNLTVIDDEIKGSLSSDILAGDDKNNIIVGEQGDDTLVGGDGDDTLYGGDGNDGLQGENGNDIIYGNEGDDFLNGEDGTDTLYGEGGRDRLFGGNGNDLLIGGDGNDLLNGGRGNDRLIGNLGNDKLIGGSDNDILEGNQGKNKLKAGTGKDTFVLHRDGFALIQDFQDKTDKIALFGVKGKQLFGRLDILQQGNHTLIKYQDKLVAKLIGVDASQITQADLTSI